MTREESLRDAAAAVAVLTNEGIRRSGARTIPDALRATREGARRRSRVSDRKDA